MLMFLLKEERMFSHQLENSLPLCVHVYVCLCTVHTL